MEDKSVLKEKELENVVGGAINENNKCEGKIVDKKPGGVFYVELNDQRIIEARLCAECRIHNIRFIVGDKVLVLLSLYDADKGMIIATL